MIKNVGCSENQVLCKTYVMFISGNILCKCLQYNLTPLLWQLTHGRLCFWHSYKARQCSKFSTTPCFVIRTMSFHHQTASG